jgi:hypothetical protein
MKDEHDRGKQKRERMKQRILQLRVYEMYLQVFRTMHSPALLSEFTPVSVTGICACLPQKIRVKSARPD